MSPTYDDIRIFAIIAHHRSFRRASCELNVTPSALSHKMRSIEERLGVRLLNRTTRSVTPTEAGQRLLSSFTPLQAQVTSMLDSVSQFRELAVGTLRLNVPGQALRLAIAPILPRFLAANPRVKVEIVSTSDLVDLVEQGFDGGVRFAAMLPLDMVSIPIGPPQHFTVVGAPSYFAHHPTPRTPKDLANAVCIGRHFTNGRRYAWKFINDQTQEVTGPLMLDDDAAMIATALSGVGLAYVYRQQVQHLIDAGMLIETMTEFCPEPEPFHFYFHCQKHMPQVLRAFVNFIKELRLEGPGISLLNLAK
jgi:DNA-binding transcriptional LysR family regulator